MTLEVTSLEALSLALILAVGGCGADSDSGSNSLFDISDGPKPPPTKAAVDATLGTGACGSLPPAQTTITFGDPYGPERVIAGELDHAVTCTAFERGDGFELAAHVSRGGKAITVDSTLAPVTSDSAIGCLTSSEAPAGHLAGPVAVDVMLNGRTYRGNDGDCWVTLGPNDYGTGKARGTLCCSQISGDTASDVCAIAGARFVVENCDVPTD